MEEIRKSKMEYQSLVENAGVGIVTTDAKGKFNFVNSALCKMIGYSKKELIGKQFAEFIHPDDRKRILKIFLNAWKYPERKPHIRFRVIHKKGNVIHLDSCSTLTLLENKIIGFSAIISDITERVSAEEKLRQSNERYRSLMEYTEDPVFLIDINLNYLYANKKILSRYGKSLDEVIGKKYRDFHSPEITEEFSKKVEEVFKSGGPLIYEHKSQRDNRYFLRTISPVKDYITGKIKAVTVFSKNITNHKKLEVEALKIQRLESIGILAGGIAHDLNNILTIILGNISLGKMNANPESKVYKRLVEAEKASMQAKDLTQQLQSFSSSKLPVKKAASIVDLLKESANFALSGSNVKCQFSIHDDILPVEIDEGQMNKERH